MLKLDNIYVSEDDIQKLNLSSNELTIHDLVDNDIVNKKDKKNIEKIFNESLDELATKTINNADWQIAKSTYFINNLFENETKITTFEFVLDGLVYVDKLYISSDNMLNQLLNIIEELFCIGIKSIDDFEFNNDFSKSLFSVFLEYLFSLHTNEFTTEAQIKQIEEDIKKLSSNPIINDKEITKQKNKKVKLESNYIKYDTLTSESILYNINQIASHTKALLINWQNDFVQNISTTNKITKDHSKALFSALHTLMYAKGSQYSFIIGVSPNNQHYVNEKVNEIDNIFTFNIQIIKNSTTLEAKLNNFKSYNLFFRSFMNYEYGLNLNINIQNTLGEASKIARYWYTQSVEKILVENELELKRASNSYLFSNLIIKNILAANVKDVHSLEVYPFDRVFVFPNSVISKKQIENFSVSEAYIKSKAAHKNIADKIIDGKEESGYISEKDRIENKIKLHELDLSNKKTQLSQEYNFESSDFKLRREDFDEDMYSSNESIINNFLYYAVNRNNDDIEKMNKLKLAYEGRYFSDGLLYLYTTAVNLKKEIPALYRLQNWYLKEKTEQRSFNESELENTKVVLISYQPQNENDKDGFTLVIIANEDELKTISELESEKSDLQTVIDILVKQKFGLHQDLVA